MSYPTLPQREFFSKQIKIQTASFGDLNKRDEFYTLT